MAMILYILNTTINVRNDYSKLLRIIEKIEYNKLEVVKITTNSLQF